MYVEHLINISTNLFQIAHVYLIEIDTLKKKTIYVLNIGRTQQSARQSNVELHANFTVFTFDRLIMSLYKFNVLICRFRVLRN